MKKVHIILPEDQLQKLDDLIPLRMRSIVIRGVLDLIIDAIDRYGSGILGLIVAGEIKLTADNQSMRQNLTRSENVEKDGQQKTLDEIS